MNGVLLLCLRSGTCLHSKQYKEGFGLPSDVLHSSDQPGTMDAISLSGILYALFLQSNASHSFDESDAPKAALKKRDKVRRSTGRADGLDIRMESMSVGDAVLHFATDRSAELMVVASMKSCVTEPNAAALTSRLMAAIMSKYHTSLISVIRNTKSFKGMSGLLSAVYQEFPDMVARSALQKLSGVQPDWFYVAHVQSFFQSAQSSDAVKDGDKHKRHWWRLSQSSTVSVPQSISPGPFQYIYRSDAGSSTWCLAADADALSAILMAVQRGTELLAAFSEEASERVRSMEVLVQLASTAVQGGDSGGDWLIDSVKEGQRGPQSGPAEGTSSQGEPQPRRSTRIFLLVEGDTMVVIPLRVMPGATGVIGTVRRVLHEDVAELAVFMEFLQAHVPEHRVKGALS